MHLVISWDIEIGKSKWGEIDEKLKKCLDGYSWVRPLTTFYVVRTDSEVDRTRLKEKLVAVAKAESATVHIVITPSMAGGRYDGYLPSDAWEKLNKRSDP